MTRRIAALASSALAAALSAVSAAAAPLQDTSNIITLQVENDAVSTLHGTSDQYYTSGLRLGWTSGTNQVPGFLEDFGTKLWGDGVQRVSLDISQSIFTPRATQLANPSLEDRPYAGVLGITGALIHDTDSARTVLSAMVGMVGPDAGGQTIQNGFHTLIGDTPNRGWSTQIHNEPLFEITPERTWRFALGQAGPMSFDILPSVTAGFGLLRNYVQGGVVVRMGQGLGTDFGVARIRPGLSGGDAYTPTQPFVWYVFGGLDGQAVGTDVTLTGDNFSSSRHVAAKWDVGEVEGGAAVMYGPVRLTYTQVWQTQEFRTQKAGLFSFGSLAGAVRF